MKKRIFFSLLLGILFISCTSNSRTRNWGGTSTFYVEENLKVINVTWKEDNLWILTKERTPSDTTIDTYYFKEKSSWNILEGTFVIKEQ